MTPYRSDSGTEELLYRGRHLHSIRNPQREADRLVAVQLEGSGALKRIHRDFPVNVFMLNPGIPFAAASVQRHFPASRITALYSDSRLFSTVKANIPASLKAEELVLTCFTVPGELQHYLSTLLPSLGFLATVLIVWPASAIVDGHDRLQKEYLAAMKEMQRAFSTRAFFGRRWLANALKNSRFSGNSRPELIGPAMLCASGPSLEDSLDYIRSRRDSATLWALSSAVPTLASAGLQPDAVITSDGGYWAGVHLRTLPASSLLIAARTAAIPPSIAERHGRTSLFSLEMPFEDLLPGNSPPASYPERGTVLFTAMDILGGLNADAVLLFGADFNTRGLQSHSRPHAFDSYIESGGNRLEPLCGDRWRRSRGDDLSVYADWLTAGGSSENWPPVYRWKGSGLSLPAVSAGDGSVVFREVTEHSELDAVLAECGTASFTPGTAADAPGVRSEKEPSRADAFALRPAMDAVLERAARDLDGALFSSPRRRQELERAIGFWGVQVKNAWLRWVSDFDEEKAVTELRRNIARAREDGR